MQVIYNNCPGATPFKGENMGLYGEGIPDPTFVGMPKIPRLNRLCWITEKIDGTNAQVVITDDGNVLACSRTKYITPNVEGNKNDNHGFAQWVEGSKADLLKLGPGRHFGEWWGKGINRGYGMKEKIFSLFNVERWSNPVERPDCCSVVPVILKDDFGTAAVNMALDLLRKSGSWAAPGFMKPEGIVIFHVALNGYFKVTLENDEAYKTKDV